MCKEKEDIESEYTALKSTNWVQKINQMESEKNELIQTSNELRTEISALQQELKIQRITYIPWSMKNL